MLADGCLYSLLAERFQYFTGKGKLRVYADSHKSNSWKLEKPVNAIVKKMNTFKRWLPWEKKGINNEKFHTHKSVETTNYTIL